MKQYECDLCGYVYDEAAGDPDNGIAPGTKWEDLPQEARDYVEHLEKAVGCKITYISVGAEREAYIHHVV